MRLAALRTARETRDFRARKAMEDVRYLTGAIRLRDKPAAVWQNLQLAPAESRRHDDPDRRPPSPHCLREFDPIHRSRHVNVGEHNSDVVPAFQDTDGFVRVRRPERLKSRVSDHVDREHQDKRLVLDREHHRSMRSFQRNPIRVARPKRNVFWQSAASFNVQRDTFDPPQIDNSIDSLTMSEATCCRLVESGYHRICAICYYDEGDGT